MQARIFITQKTQHYMMQLIQYDPNLKMQLMKQKIEQKQQFNQSL